MIECPKCGGNGGCPGSDFGDYGWHPCFFCGETGFVTPAQMATYERECQEVRQEEYRGYRPEWDIDFDSYPSEPYPGEEWNFHDFEPEHRLTGEDIPF